MAEGRLDEPKPVIGGAQLRRAFGERVAIVFGLARDPIEDLANGDEGWAAEVLRAMGIELEKTGKARRERAGKGITP